MTRFTRFWLVSFLTTLPLACSATDPVDSGDAGMHAALTDTLAENTEHAKVCKNSDTMPLLLEEVTRHARAMGNLMVRMDEADKRMRSGPMMPVGHCSGPAFEHLSQCLTTMPQEMVDHQARMRAAESAEIAQTECRTHTEWARIMIQSMMTDLDWMPCMAGR